MKGAWSDIMYFIIMVLHFSFLLCFPHSSSTTFMVVVAPDMAQTGSSWIYSDRAFENRMPWKVDGGETQLVDWYSSTLKGGGPDGKKLPKIVPSMV